MNDHLTDLLTTTLKGRADQVTDPGPDALTDLVLPRAHRAVRRRRAAAGVGVAALATAVATTGWWVSRQGLSSPPPIAQSPATTSATPTGSSSPTPSPSPSSTSPSSTTPAVDPTASTLPAMPSAKPALDSTREQIWELAQKLPQGAAISTLPRAEKVGDTVRVVLPVTDGPGGVVVLPSDTGNVRQIVPTMKGWLVVTSSVSFTGGGPDEGAALYLIGPDNKPTALLRGISTDVVVNPDATKYAVGVMANTQQLSTLVINEIGAAQTKDPKAPQFENLQLMAWTAEGIWFNDLSLKTMLLGADGTHPQVARAIRHLSDTGRGVNQMVSIEARDDKECVLVATRVDDGRVAGCATQMTYEILRNGMILVTATDNDQKRFYLLNADALTFQPLTVPDVIGANHYYSKGGDGEPALYVMALHPVDNQSVWLRWNLDTGTVERAALPAGVDLLLYS